MRGIGNILPYKVNIVLEISEISFLSIENMYPKYAIVST